MNVQSLIEDLRTLDAQNPGVWPRWIRVTAVVLLSIAIIAGGIYYVVKPVYEDWKRAQAQEQSLRTEFENKQKKVASLDAFRKQLADMEKLFGTLLKQLPGKAEIANLLNDVSQTRVAASLEEELFKPLAERPKDFYAIVPNQITVVGQYHDMASFVSQIAALPRIVTIENVTITRAGRKNSGDLRMKAVAQTYRYLDESEMKPAKSKRKRGRRR